MGSSGFELAITPPRPRQQSKKLSSAASTTAAAAATAAATTAISPLRKGSLNHPPKVLPILPLPQQRSLSPLTHLSTSTRSPSSSTNILHEHTLAHPVPNRTNGLGRTTLFGEPPSFSGSTSAGDMSMVDDDDDDERQRSNQLQDEQLDLEHHDWQQEQEQEQDQDGDLKPDTILDAAQDDSDDDQDQVYKPVLHVEVRLKPTGSVRTDTLRTIVRQYLLADESSTITVEQNCELDSAWTRIAVLDMYVERIWIAESDYPHMTVPLSQVELEIHLYQPALSSRTSDCFISTADDDYENQANEDDGPAASVLELPSLSLEGIWDNLIYEEPVKENLLNYIHSSMEFSDHDVDFNIVSWNRVCLLHGPPGSGKTSLCRALAQKLAIRLSTTYRFGRLIEINSHSLFSKWFSESGKLVQKLFASVTEMVEDEEGFAVVLIDEVESLTAARAGAMSGKEPSDALRSLVFLQVVNALLTQLDKLKTRKNCLVITTSNLSEAIDPAFIDRADIKQYVGLPPPPAIYWILRSSLLELMSKRMIRPQSLLTYDQLSKTRLPSTPEGTRSTPSHRLFDLATECRGMSGRTLRKLPILAHSKFLTKQVLKGRAGSNDRGLKLERWLEALERVVREEKRQKGLIEGAGRKEGFLEGERM
ncbi:BQ5605_C007g04756 [Microbotryum silenes-dioicae]|uniref:BQ5605_C007g04756 protein n=1 Tax=Microbotryum silenes-dioicae TaxID=796604 RepID=A0A2X0MB04_9BASI|nr:BQ5605_C007g04756 [Microbotryum silenes-dioicae]